MRKKAREKSAAVLTVRDVPAMTRKGRKAIATWLRNHATTIEFRGNLLANRYTARYLYR